MKKTMIVVTASTVLLVVFFAAARFYQAQQDQQVDSLAQQNMALLVREHSPRKGDPQAKVTLVEFFDPACETCKVFHPFVMRLMDENPGKIQVIMRYAPFHRGSDSVVALLEAARLQDKFWPTLEAAFAAQEIWASHTDPQPQKLWMQLGDVGLDFTRAQQDMQSEQTISNINQDIADLTSLGINKTPSFFVNGKPLVDFGFGQLRYLVESEIREVY